MLVTDLTATASRRESPSDDALRARVVEATAMSYQSLVSVAARLAVTMPQMLVEPRIRAAIQLGFDLDAWSADDAFVLLQALLAVPSAFDALLRLPERASTGLRLRAAGVARAIALAARDSGLSALVPPSRHNVLFSLMERLCRDRHAAVAFRTSYAVGLLERDRPSLPAEVGLLLGTPLMTRRRVVSLAARWIHGDIDDEALDAALAVSPGSRDTYARASFLQGLRLGHRFAPKTVTRRATSLLTEPSTVVLASAIALARALHDEGDRTALSSAVESAARGKNLIHDPVLRGWLAPSPAAAELLARASELADAASLSPVHARASALSLLEAVVTTISALDAEQLGEGDDTEAVLDAALFESTLLPDSLTASAATLHEASASQETFSSVVRRIGARRASQALKPGLHPSQRRERIRLMTHALDAATGESGPGAPPSGERALAAMLLDLVRRESGTVNDRPLATALAVCVERDIDAGRLDLPDAVVVLAQLPARLHRHLATAFSDAETCAAFAALDHLVQTLASVDSIDQSGNAPPSRRPGMARQRAAQSLEDALWRLTRAVAALGAVGDHPLARAMGGATAAAVYVLQNRNGGEDAIDAWTASMSALHQALANARVRLGIAATEGPKADVIRRRVADAFQASALEHETDTRGISPRPFDTLLDASLRLRGGKGGASWRGAKVGDFVVVKELGAGGMGRCLLGRLRTEKPRDGAQWVIKLPNDSARGERGKIARDLFREEARALLSLAAKPHRGIVEFVAYHEQGYALPFVVMRLVAGTSLASAIEERRFEPAEALSVTAELASALAHAHAHGVGHHDVKPDNIILAARDNRPVLVDWGLAGATFRGHAGTPSYMSPERFEAIALPSEQAFGGDVWALGCIFLEMLAGHALVRAIPRADDEAILPGFASALSVMPEGYRLHFACRTVATVPALLDARVAEALAGVDEPVAALVKSMLHRDPARRPTAASVTEAARSMSLVPRPSPGV